MKKSKFLTFCFSFFFGAGQMYLGYMKRGASFMIAFCGLIGIAGFLNLGMLTIALPVIWAYAFFDTFAIAGFTQEQRAAKPDAWIVDPGAFTSPNMRTLMEKRHKLFGWALIAVGAYSLYSTFINRYLWNFFAQVNFQFGLTLIDGIPTLVVAGLVIVLGLWLVKGPELPREEYVAFKGGAAQPSAFDAQSTPAEPFAAKETTAPVCRVQPQPVLPDTAAKAEEAPHA